MPQFDTQFLTPLLFWSIVSFGLLLFILYKYAFPPLLEVLDAREKKIKESLEHAERLQQEARALMSEYETRIKNARQETEAILEKAKARSQQILEESEKKNRQESERMIASTRQEIEREKIKLMKEVRQFTGDLVVSATEKLLQRTLNKTDHQRLIEESIELAAQSYKSPD
ncbi:MAG: F0F1 ATP synthase subunit B [Nitrospirae bacterium]|nr:F0F1 ATP synthase subunit B [Nitrospirota bacterium]